MSQTDSTDDAGAQGRTVVRLRTGLGAVKVAVVELWLVAFGLFSTVGYGVRDGFDRRPAVGVIYTAIVTLASFGAVAGGGTLLGVDLLGPRGVAAAVGFVTASTAGSVVLTDTANRDYRGYAARRLSLGTAADPTDKQQAATDAEAASTEAGESVGNGDAQSTATDDAGDDAGGTEEPAPDHADPQRGSDAAGNSDGMSGQYVTAPPDIDFDDVAGFDDLKTELHERVIDPLEEPEKYEKYGLSVENGFLLYGPPGTGKTYISKALAGELAINYIGVKGSDIISKWLGEGTQNVAELFAEARDHQPCLIFVDEIDALTPERTSANQHQDQTQMVNQFLEEISDINESDADIVIVGATNRRDQIDNAMLRSGRLSVQIEVGKPGAKTRVAIFDVHLNAPRSADLDATEIAQQSTGLTAADMEQVATEAARSAMRREGKVTTADVSAAIDEVRN